MSWSQGSSPCRTRAVHVARRVQDIPPPPDPVVMLRREVGYLRCLVAVLTERLGGTVTFTPDQVVAAATWEITATESPALGDATTLHVEKR